MTVAAKQLKLTNWQETNADGTEYVPKKGWKTEEWGDDLFEETVLVADERLSGLEPVPGMSTTRAIDMVQNGGKSIRAQLRMVGFAAWKLNWLRAIDNLYKKINKCKKSPTASTWRGVTPKPSPYHKPVGVRRFGPLTTKTLMVWLPNHIRHMNARTKRREERETARAEIQSQPTGHRQKRSATRASRGHDAATAVTVGRVTRSSAGKKSNASKSRTNARANAKKAIRIIATKQAIKDALATAERTKRVTVIQQAARDVQGDAVMVDQQDEEGPAGPDRFHWREKIAFRVIRALDDGAERGWHTLPGPAGDWPEDFDYEGEGSATPSD